MSSCVSQCIHDINIMPTPRQEQIEKYYRSNTALHNMGDHLGSQNQKMETRILESIRGYPNKNQ